MAKNLVNKKKLSVIISVMNAMDITEFCLDCLQKNINEAITEVIVIDNASSDGTAQWLRTEKWVRVVRNDVPQSLAASFNQGLEIAGGEEILFMHNDVFLPPNTVARLEEMLFRREGTGAVAPAAKNQIMVVNCLQNEDVVYSDFATLCLAAEKLFATDGGKSTGQLYLEDSCVLVKKEAVKAVGNFDECFAVRYGEDFDYFLRMVRSGWTLERAEGILVHHQRSVTITANRVDGPATFKKSMEQLENKWGVDFLYSACLRHELIEQIDYSLPELSVLDIGCAMGANFAYIRAKRPDAGLCGIELNPAAAAVAATFGDVRQADVEKLEVPEWEGAFDFIIMGDILEHLREPKELLVKARKLLKKNGTIIASLPNVMNVEVVAGLLSGRWKYEQAGVLDRTHLRFFTKKEMFSLFDEAGYKAECFDGYKCAINENIQGFLHELEQLKTIRVDTEQMKYVQFYFKAVPK